MKSICLLLAAASMLALSSCNCLACKKKDAAACATCKDGTCDVPAKKKM